MTRHFSKDAIAIPGNTGSIRTYIGKTRSELYPQTPHLEKEAVEFAQDWFVATNISNVMKEKILRMACDVAGVRYGIDLKVSW